MTSAERTARRRIDEQRDLEAAARELRRLAIAGSYAGMRGEYVAFHLAALLEGVARHHAQMPGVILTDALTAARHLLWGPDGVHDPRANQTSLADGPGH